jgi:hypothetical protein
VGYQGIDFYASAYDWNGQTIISYRGTNLDSIPTDITYGYGVDAGFPYTAQAADAIAYFKSVAQYEDPAIGDDWQSAEITVTGHSLGGGLAGLVGSIYGLGGVLFDNMTFNAAANLLFEDASSSKYPGLSTAIYGSQRPYPLDTAGLNALATTGEVLEGLLPLRQLQTPPVSYLVRMRRLRRRTSLEQASICTAWRS